MKVRFRRRSFVNFTLPSTRENKVWSFPIPTFNPGWNSVPRWRTIMLPGEQRWPPYNLTPRYLGLESLLFWVEPPCFLEAHRICWNCDAAKHSATEEVEAPTAKIEMTSFRCLTNKMRW